MSVKRVSEIRTAFLEYFQNKNHHIVDSASLVPQGDDSLMFVNAGMVQFKNYFTGVETPKFKRADRKSTRLNSSHSQQSRMPSSA